MKKIKPYEKLQKEYKNIQLTKNRIDKQLMFKKDKEKAYEWLFLYSVTIFENYIEEIFLWILKSKFSAKKWSWIILNKDIIFSKSINDSNIKKIVLWEKGGSYLDWLPYDKTKNRAKRFFINWKPFSDITGSKKDILEEIITIRNYIAHKSKESKIKFYSNYTYNIKNLYWFFTKTHSWWNDNFDNFLLELNSISWFLQQNFK